MVADNENRGRSSREDEKCCRDCGDREREDSGAGRSGEWGDRGSGAIFGERAAVVVVTLVRAMLHAS
jgi:hypothetical protein